MTNVKNELPVAVHVASGGEARMRSGGLSISLDGLSSGSFQLLNGTRYRAFLNARGTSGVMVLFSYQNPPSLSNSSMRGTDLGEAYDDVPEGTTVYWLMISMSTLQPVEGTSADFLYVSFYS